MITIRLKDSLKPEEEQWLTKNIGPRMHWLSNSIGGEGWILKRELRKSESLVQVGWTLTLEDDRYATIFLLMFPQ
jgi:hypothetical protein